MSEIDVINDYKDMIKRLQQECTEKTNVIIFLGEQLHRYKQVIEEIKKIAEKYVNNCNFSWGCEKCSYECYSQQIIQKCEEVNNE